MYSLTVLDERAHKHLSVCQLTETEFEEIHQLINYLDRIFDNDTKYEMVRRNCSVFLKYCEGITPVELNSGEVFIEVNRLFENVVESFYSWIGYNEKNFNNVFSAIKKSYFDNNVEYRLAYGLRIYCEHHALSFRSYTLKLDTNEMVLDVDPALVLSVKKNDGKPIVNADIQKDLEEIINKGEGIHLRDLVIGLDMLMPRIERDIMKEIHKKVNPRMAHLMAPIGDIRTGFLYIRDAEERPVTNNLVAPIKNYYETMEKHGAKLRN